MAKLSVRYDPDKDHLEVEGTVYAGNFFRELGCNFKDMVGQVLRVDKKENGVVTLTRIHEVEEQIANQKIHATGNNPGA